MLWTLEVLIDEKRFDGPPRKNSDLVDMLAGVVGLEKCGRTVEVTCKATTEQDHGEIRTGGMAPSWSS
jgi:hypothetical protein